MVPSEVTINECDKINTVSEVKLETRSRIKNYEKSESSASPATSGMQLRANNLDNHEEPAENVIIRRRHAHSANHLPIPKENVFTSGHTHNVNHLPMPKGNVLTDGHAHNTNHLPMPKENVFSNRHAHNTNHLPSSSLLRFHKTECTPQ
ncbi:hypothetical protein Tcan_05201 [Toxocara canis]|uniref:Uncharacterized protein n=1 Tax=Toxocara canis TaxID=6265 RepID=A0A0B2V3U4_TOXCA|nr:hypothetical protein Tcan_05201 [Toxocara canis]